MAKGSKDARKRHIRESENSSSMRKRNVLSPGPRPNKAVEAVCRHVGCNAVNFLAGKISSFLFACSTATSRPIFQKCGSNVF